MLKERVDFRFLLPVLALCLGLVVLGCSSGGTKAQSATSAASRETTSRLPVTTQTTTSLAPVPATTVSTMRPTATSVDRHDPESVLRAYFSAWQNGDWEAEKSFMADMYAHMIDEPVRSLSIVDLRLAESSSTHCMYYVTFDFVPKGELISMESGRYNWSYDLDWDGQRQSWIITNYGEG